MSSGDSLDLKDLALEMARILENISINLDGSKDDFDELMDCNPDDWCDSVNDYWSYDRHYSNFDANKNALQTLAKMVQDLGEGDLDAVRTKLLLHKARKERKEDESKARVA